MSRIRDVLLSESRGSVLKKLNQAQHNRAIQPEETPMANKDST